VFAGHRTKVGKRVKVEKWKGGKVNNKKWNGGKVEQWKSGKVEQLVARLQDCMTIILWKLLNLEY
jgi:hypothetical protein